VTADKVVAMPHLRPRRSATATALAGLAAALPLAGCGDAPSAELRTTGALQPAAAETTAADAGTAIARLERRARARVGVVATDLQTGRTVTHRADERFPAASTIKVLGAAAALRRGDARLDRVVDIAGSDILEYAPVTDDFVGTGLALRHLVNASLQWSDNTAHNLVVETLGGPGRLQRAVRALGDRVTSVDRVEPELNSAVPGDPRDTTTPRAMAENLRRLLVGDALEPRHRAVLRANMEVNTTGDALVRAAVPPDWTVADKTGSAAYGTRNDIAVAWPPGRRPVVIAVYTTHDRPDAESDDRLVRDAARAALARLRGAGS
jgi:beta-lactamase class A